MNTSASGPEAAVNPNQTHVLIADDDPSVRLLLSLMLEKLGYRVTAVNDGTEAVDAVAANPASIGTVLLDIHMPQLNGVAAMDRIRLIAPNIRIILTSGTPKDDVLTSFAPKPPWLFLEKPFHFNELSAIFPPIPKKA